MNETKVRRRTRPIDKLYKQKGTIDIKILKLRKRCKHEKHSIQMYSWRVGCYDPRRLCLYCDEVLEGGTAEEINDFYEKNPVWASKQFTPIVSFTVSNGGK